MSGAQEQGCIPCFPSSPHPSPPAQPGDSAHAEKKEGLCVRCNTSPVRAQRHGLMSLGVSSQFPVDPPLLVAVLD